MKIGRSGLAIKVSTPTFDTRIEDRRITIIEIIAEKLQVGPDTVHNNITTNLKYCKTNAKWVPRELIDHYKEMKVRIRTELQKY